MAWSTPRTWVAGETVTAALMNTHVRDMFNFIATAPCELWVKRSTDQTISNATITAVVWNSEDRDQGFGWSPSSSTITIPETGIYSVSFYMQWSGLGTARGGGLIEVSGLSLAPRAGHGGPLVTNNHACQKAVAATMRMVAGQVITCYVRQANDSTTSMTLQPPVTGAGGNAGTRLSVVQVQRELVE